MLLLIGFIISIISIVFLPLEKRNNAIISVAILLFITVFSLLFDISVANHIIFIAYIYHSFYFISINKLGNNKTGIILVALSYSIFFTIEYSKSSYYIPILAINTAILFIHSYIYYSRKKLTKTIHNIKTDEIKYLIKLMPYICYALILYWFEIMVSDHLDLLAGNGSNVFTLGTHIISIVFSYLFLLLIFSIWLSMIEMLDFFIKKIYIPLPEIINAIKIKTYNHINKKNIATTFIWLLFSPLCFLYAFDLILFSPLISIIFIVKVVLKINKNQVYKFFKCLKITIKRRIGTILHMFSLLFILIVTTSVISYSSNNKTLISILYYSSYKNIPTHCSDLKENLKKEIEKNNITLDKNDEFDVKVAFLDAYNVSLLAKIPEEKYSPEYIFALGLCPLDKNESSKIYRLIDYK